MRRYLCLLACLWLATISALAQDGQAIVGGKRWAMVVGAGNYEHFSKLNYTVSGAKQFASKLVSSYGFAQDSVQVLTDDAAPNLVPTAGHILGELSALLQDKRLDKSDLFIFYFSGHGIGMKSGDYLVPVDARPATAEQLGVPVKKVIEQFVQAGLRNVLIIADACRSGSENPFGAELQELAAKANIAVMLGCKPGQVSREDPRLKAGIFSHFLLQALDDPTLRDPASGAVWARPLAEKVSDTAYKHGQREFGEYSQRPTAWTDPTRDVLLGVFPTGQAGDAELKSFLATAQKLNKKDYGLALNEYATRLFELDRLREAVEVFKVLEQIGEMADDSRYLYTVALTALDRNLEAARVIEKFGAGEESQIFKDLSIASCLSDTLLAEDKIKSAIRVWQAYPSWSVGQILWVNVKHWGTIEQKHKYGSEVLELVKDEPRIAAYMKGELAIAEGKYREGMAVFEQAKKAPGDDPSNHNIDLAMHSAILAGGTSEELEKFLKERASDLAHGYMWATLLGKHYRANGKTDEMMKAFKTAVSGPIDALYLWIAVRFSGIRAGELADLVDKAAERHPLAWRAILAKTMADSLRDGTIEDTFKAYEKTPEFLEEKSVFTFEAITYLWLCCQDYIASGKIKETDLQIFFQPASADMTKYAADLEQDAEYWNLYLELMLRGQKGQVLGKVIRKYFDLENKMSEIRAEIRPLLLMALANARDTSAVEALGKAGGTIFQDGTDSQLVLAAYFALENRFDEAEAMLPKPKTVTPSLESTRLAVEGMILAHKGNKARAKEIADSLEETVYLQTQPLVGMIYAALGNWEKATIFFEASRVQRSWGLLFLHEAALKRYFEHCVETGQREMQEILNYEASLLMPASGWQIATFSGAKPSIENFAGTSEFTFHGNADWTEPVEGKLTLTVLASGKVTGIAELGGDKTALLSGNVDPYGNLRGKVKYGGTDFELSAKLLTSEMMQHADVKANGVLFQLLRQDMLRMVWMCNAALPTPARASLQPLATAILTTSPRSPEGGASADRRVLHATCHARYSAGNGRICWEHRALAVP